jgi:hypothetical protein
VSPFVLSPEIEDRDEVKVGNWAKHKKTLSRLATGRSTKRPSTLNGIYILFYLQADHRKKIGHELIYLHIFLFLQLH